MIRILTWNIQATKGCDDKFDLDRICYYIDQYGDLDVICLQELSRNIEDLNGDDQLESILVKYPLYEAVWGPGFSAVTTDGKRAEFGNLTLVKRPNLINSRTHCLPSPCIQDLQMPRTMVEVLVKTATTNLSIFNTHLAFHSEEERVAQTNAIATIMNQISENSIKAVSDDLSGPYRFSNASDSIILCGDLNIDSESDIYTKQLVEKNWVDCWTKAPQQKLSTRQPTCGCHDHIQWPQGPHVRDYFFATSNIADKTLNVEVDVVTNASDHQPVLLEMAL